MVLRLPKLLDDGCVLQAGATYISGAPATWTRRAGTPRWQGPDYTGGGRRLMERVVRSDHSRRTVRFDGAL